MRVVVPVESCITTDNGLISNAVLAVPEAELTVSMPVAATAPLRIRMVVS